MPQIKRYSSGRGLLSINVAPNQKVVEIHKINPKKGKILDIDSNKLAMQQLSLAAYALYMHFVLNVPGYQEALSSKLLTDSTALSPKTYYKAVNELIAKGYLVRDLANAQFPEYYHFFENPSLSVSNSSQSPFPSGEGLHPDESLDEI